MNDQGIEFVRQKAVTLHTIFKIVKEVENNYAIPLDNNRLLEFTKIIYEQIQDEA